MNKKNSLITRLITSLLVVIMIFVVLINYALAQRERVIDNAEYVTNQMAEYISANISNELGYAKSSIVLVSNTISKAMTADTLENPSEVIVPMIEKTPFGSIEYIRADGMNVMNIGQPFDASDRVYYIEGIKGNTGIWNNYHPKTSKDTLINFYTPLYYDNNIVGVITGYIEANRQVASLFETNLYGKEIEGFIVDENNMVICSTDDTEYVKDLTLDMLVEKFDALEEQKKTICEIVGQTDKGIVTYSDRNGEGRICMVPIAGTEWKVAIVVPSESFNEIADENIRSAVLAIFLISLVIVIYCIYILFNIHKRRKEAEEKNAILEEENKQSFAEIMDIKDIISSANMGMWHIELIDGKEPRMFVDETMRKLLGITSFDNTPEQTYTDWFSNVTPEAVDSVLKSVGRMQEGYFDENTYLWKHPTKGVRYVRCGGTAQKIKGGYLLRGYHYDVDDVVREDQAKVVMLKQALDEKNEYFTTLDTLGDIFYSMHVIDLKKDVAVEFSARNQVREIVNQNNDAAEMMKKVMSLTTTDDYRQAALEFTDLHTLSDRMKDKKIMSRQFLGRNVGWVLASFITMEKDNEGRPTKVIYTTRIIDEEKKQQQQLIEKSQTDELTGLFNRRAYEEDIYAHNDTPSEDNFVYISLDVNGLKVINDTLGHTAGDELIVGACSCMKRCFGSYGRLYRIGGDEFAAIIFCDLDKLKDVLEDFNDTMANWSGKIVESLSISYGYATKQEAKDASVRQLSNIAEKRMYESKELHYRQKGVDRRGQKDAHIALCALYTKILKINLTDDSYQIVNMDESERTKEKGFSDKISTWLKAFAEAGQVHKDDVEEYLRKTDTEYLNKYFESDKTSLHIIYRRKFDDGYKQVMMEIIPANDYSADNRSFFLYVKNIDI